MQRSECEDGMYSAVPRNLREVTPIAVAPTPAPVMPNRSVPAPTSIGENPAPPSVYGGRRKPAPFGRWVLWIVAMLALFAIGVFRGWFSFSGPTSLTALGTIEATEVSISSQVSARIVTINVDEGDIVQPGETLVQLDDSLAHLQYIQAPTPADQQELGLQLGYYTLVAPRAGVVIRRSAEPGEMAMPGAPLLVVADVYHPEL